MAANVTAVLGPGAQLSAAEIDALRALLAAQTTNGATAFLTDAMLPSGRPVGVTLNSWAKDLDVVSECECRST